MVYLLDTNVLGDLEQPNARVVSRLQRLTAGDRAVICATVRGEVLFGLERMPAGRRKDDLTADMLELLSDFACEPITAAVADRYATTKRACQRRGRPVDENDLWIAATALAIGAVLVSRDSDVHSIAGLTVEDWTR